MQNDSSDELWSLHMETVLVAGANGVLGRHVLGILRAHGYRVRALTRSAAHGRALGDLADQVIVGDATRPETLTQACQDATLIFSCLGQSVNLDLNNRGPGYRAIDYVGNHNLITMAKAAGVRRFGYVSVFGAERFPQLAYMKAHADVAAELRASGLSYAIICPTGFFSAFDPILAMAQSGRASLIGDGTARSNPIHDADLAEVCVQALLADTNQVIEVGGPETLSRRQIIELAFTAVGKPVQISGMPVWTANAMSAVAAPFAPRVAELMAFAAAMFTSDSIAPAQGNRRLADYFAGLASR
jgi:uncharacterized protein YbjT (DUF2867 family)